MRTGEGLVKKQEREIVPLARWICERKRYYDELAQINKDEKQQEILLAKRDKAQAILDMIKRLKPEESEKHLTRFERLVY